jgi:ABC-type nitrate/sulfonate/bicarbonate transport system ATPase subunit/ABC-type transporter Mla maintaining outer membrane lipid asymmetry permease subunit MlaE
LTQKPLLTVRGLTITLGGTTPLVEGAEVLVHPGEIVALLGPSGSGKSTLVTAALAPESLRARGATVTWSERSVAVPWAFVPQRGALFDHLDVAGNIALALEAGGQPGHIVPWLEAVELDPSLGAPGRRVSALSGGQAQRVAVARTLAAGRRLLVLDEPSVGIDPAGVNALARLLVSQARTRGVGVLLITHDLSLVAGAASRVLFLDGARRRLGPVESLPWDGPAAVSREDLERAVEDALVRARPDGDRGHAPAPPARGPGALWVLGSALRRALSPTLFRASTVVLRRVLAQALWRPLPFYAVVGLLLGVTVPYVVANLTTDLRPGAALRLVGGTYVVTLAPPLSAILFVATSGSAVAAWLGGLQLGRQVQALEGLGVSPPRYLLAPAWVALAWAYLAGAGVFAAAMLAGGWALFELYGVPHALSVVTSDFWDPVPSRLPFSVRAVWLVGAYALSLASIVVARGAGPKDRAEDVTAAMTSAVVRATLWVVVLELATVALLFALAGRPGP